MLTTQPDEGMSYTEACLLRSTFVSVKFFSLSFKYFVIARMSRVWDKSKSALAS